MTRPQMTLREFIRALERQEPDDPVKIDFVHFGPTTFDSYRGYYEQLALGYNECGRMSPRGDESYQYPTVAKLLEHARETLGREFTGWKGGNYVMHGDTVLWISNPGETGSTAIVNVEKHLYVTIMTELVDD